MGRADGGFHLLTTMGRGARAADRLVNAAGRGGRMRPHVLQRAVGLLLLLLSVWMAGCATMRGLGEDIQSLGRGIRKVFTQ